MIYKYNLDGSLCSVYKTLNEAAINNNTEKKKISNACYSVNHKHKEYLWSYELKKQFLVEDLRKKGVQQLELDGELVSEYKSVAEASRITGISKTCIARVCRGEREFSSGYIWKYI